MVSNARAHGRTHLAACNQVVLSAVLMAVVEWLLWLSDRCTVVVALPGALHRLRVRVVWLVGGQLFTLLLQCMTG